MKEFVAQFDSFKFIDRHPSHPIISTMSILNALPRRHQKRTHVTNKNVIGVNGRHLLEDTKTTPTKLKVIRGDSPTHNNGIIKNESHNTPDNKWIGRSNGMGNPYVTKCGFGTRLSEREQDVINSVKPYVPHPQSM